MVRAEIKILSFDQSVKESDLIVRVTTKDKSGKLDGPIPKTLFDANVEEIISDKNNKAPNTVKIMQQGNEEFTFHDNELFQKNEELILFLKEAQTVANAYWIIGEETNIYKVNGNEVTKNTLMDNQLDDITKKTYLNDKKNCEFRVVDKDQFIKKIKAIKK